MATTAGDDPTPNVPGDSAGSSASAGTTLPAAPPPRSNAFFTWIRGLGIRRAPGWMGGVCAGIAARLGLDPILVRGIVVVIAVLGGPVVLLYAAAWLLLPDERDLIHAEELGRGRFSPAIAGIGALVLLSLLPLTQGFWYAGALYWGEPHVGASVGRLLWTAVLITALVLFVIWIARRSSSSPVPAPASAAPAPGPDAGGAPAFDAGTAAFAATATEARTAPAAGSEPPRPAADASKEEFDAWRAQQDEWQRQRAAWAAEQRRTDRELAAQAARERARRDAEAAMERARIRRLTRPRVSGAYVVITLGAALIAGAIAALLRSGADGGYDATVGWAAAVFVLGVAIALAGALRKRSGFLAFVSIVALLIMIGTLFAPDGRRFLFPEQGVTTAQSGDYFMPAGSLLLSAYDDGNDELAGIDILQGVGSVQIEIEAGQTLRLNLETGNANFGDRSVQHFQWDRDGDVREVPVDVGPTATNRVEASLTIGTGAPDAVVDVWQGRGSIIINEQTTEDVTP